MWGSAEELIKRNDLTPRHFASQQVIEHVKLKLQVDIEKTLGRVVVVVKQERIYDDFFKIHASFPLLYDVYFNSQHSVLLGTKKTIA